MVLPKSSLHGNKAFAWERASIGAFWSPEEPLFVLLSVPYMEARLTGCARASMVLLGPRKSLDVAHEVVLALDP